MKREILLLFSAAAFALTGCATNDADQGRPSTDYSTVYGPDEGRGENWRVFPPQPTWDSRAPGDFHP